MFERQLAAAVERSRRGYPAALILGPRQSGKTVLVRSVFDDLPYVNLESPLERAEVLEDPLGFLARFPDGAILDEIQNTPELVSYLQVRIDEERRMGRWALTGSHQIHLAGRVQQSLAGRVAQFQLLPFSRTELRDSARLPSALLDSVLRGGYPPLYDDALEIDDPSEWLEDYVATFVNRDVHGLLDLQRSRAFDVFLKRCAPLTGQAVNKSDLGQLCGVDSKTVDAWLQVLEIGYLARIVRPYHRNFGKRLSKQPRLYFLDTGVACRLLGITHVDQLAAHPLKGALIETWYFTEVAKFLANHRRSESVTFWRTGDGHEVDFVIESGHRLIPVEAKSTSTPSSRSIDGIRTLQKLRDRDPDVTIDPGIVFYAGQDRVDRGAATFVPWSGIEEALSERL